MDNLMGLKWPAPATREFRMTVVMLHGDGFETFTEAGLSFPDSPEGHERLQFAMNALPFISAAAESRRSAAVTAYDICVAAGEAMSVPTAKLTDLFAAMFVRDARHRRFLALPVAYTLEHRSEAGIRRAAFPYGFDKHRPFKVITNWSLDPKYLAHWA